MKCPITHGGVPTWQLARCGVATLLLAAAPLVHPTVLGAQQQAPPAPAAGSAERRDVLVGRVTGPAGNIEGATISVWAAGTDSTQRLTARSNSDGRWLVSVPAGRGDYMVRINALGMKAMASRVLRTAEGVPITLNVRLESSPLQLAAMNVTATVKPRAPRADGQVNAASGDRQANATEGRVAGQDLGDFAAVAAAMPGITLVDGGGAGAPGFSVAGLGAGANNVTVNGMLSTSSGFPRDALGTTVRVSTTPWDVSRGGFSGGQVTVQLASGNNIASRVARVTVDAPQFQLTDRVGRQLGNSVTDVRVSGAAIGALRIDRVFYNMGFQAGRRQTDLFSLATADPFVLQRVGVASDSATRLLSTTAGMGLPIARTGIPNQRFTDNALLWTRLDLGRGADTTKGYITAQLRYDRGENAFTGATQLPIAGGSQRTVSADVTANYSNYLSGTEYLNDFFIGASVNDSRNDPYSLLPAARVLVRSDFDVGVGGLQTLQLGGSTSLPRTSQRSIIQGRDQLSWFSASRAHRWRVGAEVRHDMTEQQQSANVNGTFSYNSIADFENGRPAIFTRTLNAVETRSAAFAGALFVGDEWNLTRRLQIVYGLRADGTLFPDRTPFNPAVQETFGARTDFVPRLVDVSPRVGFSWGFGTNGRALPGFGAPWGTLRGGIGRFRNDVASTLVDRVQRFTGLPGGVEQFSCFGQAVPVADWSAFQQDLRQVPTACADGTRSSTFAVAQPNVWLVDRGFRAQDTWRGALGITGFAVPSKVLFTIEGTWSDNRRLQSYDDLNFDGVARFTLPGEGNRPVFADVGSIVPPTGAVSNRDSRISRDFNAVTAVLSDARSVAQQLTLSLNPAPAYQLGRDYGWNASYTLLKVREALRGFTGGSGNTAGNPRDIEWARGSVPTHQIILTASKRLLNTFSLAATANIRSGVPFTPLVSGDVNGDGVFANDRAFVFDPADARLPVAMRSELTALRDGATARVRQCLDAQQGQLAARASCDAPWIATVNGTLRINPQRVGMANRTQLQFTFTNLAAGLDQLLHGEGRMRGWGQPLFPDPFLLTARGFDPVARRYRYDVNQRFGSTSLANNAFRSPFMVMMDVKVELGRNMYRQIGENFLESGRTRKGTPRDTTDIKNGLRSVVPGEFRQLIIAKDSLSLLTTEQYRRLTDLSERFQQREDAIVSPFAKELYELPFGWNRDEYARRIHAVMVMMFENIVAAMEEAGTILTPAQIAEFPAPLQAAFDTHRLRKRRPVFGIAPQW
jgi:hypothetical protein